MGGEQMKCNHRVFFCLDDDDALFLLFQAILLWRWNSWNPFLVQTFAASSSACFSGGIVSHMSSLMRRACCVT